MNLNRNDLCWCNSGKKYKICHMAMDEKIAAYKRKGHIVPTRDIIKTDKQIEKIKESAVINTGILDYITDYIKPGISTEALDRLVHDYTVAHGAIPAPLHYEGFPKSICTSINNVVCHGIPSENQILKDGDIVNIDVSTNLNGYYADASRMFMIGDVSDDAKKLVDITKECVELGLAQAKPWGFLGDIADAINSHAKANGYTVVRDVGGHGIGLEFHEEPWVSYVAPKGTEMLLVPGMMFTIEPMINAGTARVYTDQKDNWTIYTKDGSLSAQWEYMVLITDTGAEVISK